MLDEVYFERRVSSLSQSLAYLLWGDPNLEEEMLRIITDSGKAVVSRLQCLRTPTKKNFLVEDVRFSVPFLAAVVAFCVNIVVFTGSKWTLFDWKIAEYHEVNIWLLHFRP